jgi:hypothetical protein
VEEQHRFTGWQTILVGMTSGAAQTVTNDGLASTHPLTAAISHHIPKTYSFTTSRAHVFSVNFDSSNSKIKNQTLDV